MVAAGFEVVIQAGAGAGAGFVDGVYRQAGARVEDSMDADSVDVLLHASPIHPALPSRMRAGSCTVGVLRPREHPGTVRALADAGVTGVALDEATLGDMPGRCTARVGQDMVAGFHAAVAALQHHVRVPSAVVADGVVLPAPHVVVVGADTRGLQAVDVFRRLGARLTVCDVAGGAAAEVAALRARFVRLGAEELASFVAAADMVVVSESADGDTGLPGVTDTMVARMRPGSVVVETTDGDASGGVRSVPLSAGGSVTVVAVPSARSAFPGTGSELLARAAADYVVRHGRDGDLVVDLDDPATRRMVVTHDGAVLLKRLSVAQEAVLVSGALPVDGDPARDGETSGDVAPDNVASEDDAPGDAALEDVALSDAAEVGHNAAPSADDGTLDEDAHQPDASLLRDDTPDRVIDVTNTTYTGAEQAGTGGYVSDVGQVRFTPGQGRRGEQTGADD